MQSENHSVIDVSYRYMDGYHVFTSDDVYGLYVASKDARKAFDGVGTALEALLKRNHDMHVSVDPALPFCKFIQARLDRLGDTQERSSPPQTLCDQRYVLKLAA